MKRVLSIQSHVAHGHVGNAAAVFPLQRLGFEVMPVHTVQFSNHTGYGKWTGQVFDAAHISDLLNGLEARGALENLDAILSGYLGDAAIGEIIMETVQQTRALWCCDPVMGDVGRGFFVKDDIAAFFKNKAIAAATIITPNQFELEFLTGQPITTLSEARAACRSIHPLGPEIVLLTSLIHHQTQPHEIEMLASHKNGDQYRVITPRLHIEPAPNGSGDATAALFLGHLLRGEKLAAALERTAGAIFAIFEKTHDLHRRELALIQAQDDFAHPPHDFKAEKL